MIKNFRLFAYRNLKKDKGYTLFNILGMAAGLTCFAFSISLDSGHSRFDRIYKSERSTLVGKDSIVKTPAGPLILQFIKAYNKGNFDTLRTFLALQSSKQFLSERPDRASKLAAYWMNVYSEYGAVEYHSISRVSGFETEVWTRGIISRSWLGLDFTVDTIKPYKLSDYGIVRGSRPDIVSEQILADKLPVYLESYLKTLSENKLFSGQVLLSNKDKIIFQGNYGLASINPDVKNTSDTKFYVASLSKMFTAIAILQLADKKLLSLSDNISKYLPDFPKQIGNKVTINHLLTHTSGIELDDIEGFNSAILKCENVKELYSVQLKYVTELSNYNDFTPPNKFNYSNEEYDLLGYIIEKITGDSYYSYLKENIFEPSGMKNTCSFDMANHVSMAATGFTRRDTSGGFIQGAPLANNYFMQLCTRPSGGHYSTTSDIHKFFTTLINGKILSPEFFKKAISTQILIHKSDNEEHSYGYGFQIESKNDIQMIGHGGAYYGASARFDYYPQLNYTVVVLSNQEWIANNVADHIREITGGYGK